MVSANFRAAIVAVYRDDRRSVEEIAPQSLCRRDGAIARPCGLSPDKRRALPQALRFNPGPRVKRCLS
jgi:hypothetical protein